MRLNVCIIFRGNDLKGSSIAVLEDKLTLQLSTSREKKLLRSSGMQTVGALFFVKKNIYCIGIMNT